MCACILNLSEKRRITDEQNCRDFVEDYFEGNFEAVIRFVDFYMKRKQTKRLNWNAQKRRNKYFYCKKNRYDTRYEGTREVDSVLDKIPFKRFRTLAHKDAYFKKNWLCSLFSRCLGTVCICLVMFVYLSSMLFTQKLKTEKTTL